MGWPSDPTRKYVGPLRGLKVVDLSRIIAGPLTSLYLADLGADVIKVERPTGDEMRGYGPSKWQGVGTTFLAINRNKRSMVLDLNRAEEREILLELLADADVLIESFRPGIMTRWGLDDASLREVNPRLIFCSITGFGSDGPAAGLGANNLIAEAFGGSTSVSAEIQASRLRTGPPMTDFFTGTSTALAIMAAVMLREQTGEGSRVTSSLLESQTTMVSAYILGYLATGVDPSPEAGLPFTVPNQSFTAGDGLKFVLAVNSEDMWQRMCRAIDKPEWLERPEYASNALRMQRQQEIIEQLDAIVAERPRDHWIAAFAEQRVTASPINSVAQLVAHPQFAELELLQDMTGGDIKGLRTVRPPFSISGLPWSEVPHVAPPALGADTDTIKEALR